MKRILFLCFTCVLFAFSGCSGDDDESKASSSLDASLLPGYWIMVKDGVRTNHGAWFSDGTDPQSSEDLKSVTYFYLTEKKDEPALCLQRSHWYLNGGGIMLVSDMEVITEISRLTKDRLTIWEHDLICDVVSTREFERLSEPVKIAYDPIVPEYKERKEYVKMESLPQWLVDWIATEEEKEGRPGTLFREGRDIPRLFRGEWEGVVYYNIYNYDLPSSENTFYEDGKSVDFHDNNTLQAWFKVNDLMKRVLIE